MMEESSDQGARENLGGDDTWVRSVCLMCFFSSCAIRVHRVNGVVTKIEGDPDCPHNGGRLCAKGNAGLMSLYAPHRVKTPLKRTNAEKGIGVDPQWVEISWEEALDTVAERLKRVRQDDPRKLVILTFDVPSHGTRFIPAFASAFGTPHSSSGAAAYFCGNSLHGITYLTQAAFYSDPDTDYCNYLLLMGCQTGFLVNSTPTLQAEKMADARMRGMKVVVVDPVGSNAAAKADEWIPIRPGTDAALALGMLNVLLNELEIYDAEFLKQYTNGPYLIGPDGYYLRDKATGKPLVWDAGMSRVRPFDAGDIHDFALLGTYHIHGVEAKPAFQLLKDHVRQYTPEVISEITTVPAETVRRIAREFGEAARIGSKIVIQGKELPLRPAVAEFKRGAGAHKHAGLIGLAIQLLNIVVGSLDVPGGFLGYDTIGPTTHPYQGPQWAPQESPDGLMVPGYSIMPRVPYPAREVKRPESLNLAELFPVSCSADPLFLVNMIEPEKFGVSYRPEVLIQCRSNPMATTVNPESVAEMLRRIPFQVSFAREIDETAEFADIILPDTHYLERLDAFANDNTHIRPGPGYWYYAVRQPVVNPPKGVRDWREVLIDIADRIGMLADLNVMLNVMLSMKEPYQLDPNTKYTWEDIADRRVKSRFGPEHDLNWFKEHGFIKWPKKVEEAYPRPFIKPRIPLYVEHFKRVGEEVKGVTQEMGLVWDVSDYQPLPDWKPCPDYGDKSEYDLYAVNYKLPFHTFSHTPDNPWLNELAKYHPYALNIVINTQTAKERGLKEGDDVWMETKKGYKVKGKIRVSECVHPEVLGVAGCFGNWSRGKPIARGVGLHWNSLVSADLENIDMVTTAVDSCVKVKVYK